MDFVRSYFGTNEPLTSWTLLFSLFFQISTDLEKKWGQKWSEVHFYRSNFLQNPHFRILVNKNREGSYHIIYPVRWLWVFQDDKNFFLCGDSKHRVFVLNLMEKGNYSPPLFQYLGFSEFFFSLSLEIFLFSYLECTDRILGVKMVLSHFRDVPNLGFCTWLQLLQGTIGLWCLGI